MIQTSQPSQNFEMNDSKTIYTGYKPRFHQDILHNQLKRFNVVVAHRRLGKTVFALNDKFDKAVRNQKHNPRYAYIAPTYAQAKRVAWDILKDIVRRVPNIKTNEAELSITMDRPHLEDTVKIMLLGAESPDSIRGIYLDGATLDEYAQCDPIVWTQVIRPALADRQGWATFIGTPKGNNHFRDIYNYALRRMKLGDPEWFCALLKASQTGVLPKSELEAAAALMSAAEYDQEFECSFSAAIIGAYYGKNMSRLEAAGRMTHVPYDRALPVDTAWDLGIDDSTAIWFMQSTQQGHRAINYYEVNGKGLDEIVPYMKSLGYYFRDHYLPHDVKVRELASGKTRLDTLVSLGLGKPRDMVVVPKVDPAEGINAVRMIIDKFWFDQENCSEGIEALKNYEREFNSKDGVFKGRPRHNWASHAADAMRTYAYGMIPEERREDAKNLPRESYGNDYDVWGA